MHRRALTLLILPAAIALPDAAIACTQSGEVFVVEPAADAVGVPTNVALWIIGGYNSPSRALSLTASDGAAVPFSIRPLECGSGRNPTAFLHPAASLQPHTRYTFRSELVAAPGVVYATSFETGAGPSTGEPEALNPHATQTVDNATRSSCGYNALACVGLSYRGVVDVVIRRRCDGAPPTTTSPAAPTRG